MYNPLLDIAIYIYKYRISYEKIHGTVAGVLVMLGHVVTQHYCGCLRSPAPLGRWAEQIPL